MCNISREVSESESMTALLLHLFVSGRPNSYNGVLGMAFVGTVCSVSTAGGINVVSSTPPV